MLTFDKPVPVIHNNNYAWPKINGQTSHRLVLDSKQSHVVWVCTCGLKLLAELQP